MLHCMIPDCERKVLRRGLCAGCYSSASRRVRKGETSWDELIEWGLAGRMLQPLGRCGPFRAALEAKRRE